MTVSSRIGFGAGLYLILHSFQPDTGIGDPEYWFLLIGTVVFSVTVIFIIDKFLNKKEANNAKTE